MYRELNHDKTHETIIRLQKRIRERFPDSGLVQVCEELKAISGETRAKIERISRPIWWVRIPLILLVLCIIALLVYTISNVEFAININRVVALAEAMEAVVNDLILLGAGMFFLFTIESRMKRAKVLAALHEIRALAHVIDMHQLTKDPTEMGTFARGTASSPKRTLSAYELNRYLDYCGEMLSILGKLAAVYAQHFPDNTVLNAVNEVEGLTTGLTQKIWQKIMILKQELRHTSSSQGGSAPDQTQS